MTTDIAAWPCELVDVATHPDDAAPRWAQHIQGAAVGRGCWFITQSDRIWRFPLDLDLTRAAADDPQVTNAGIPEQGIDHLGDCDVHQDRLYVAMEGTAPARIGVFDLDLEFLGSAAVTAQGGSCPWCAINPCDGLLYSSSFDADHLCVYEPIHAAGSFWYRHVHDVALWSEHGTRLRLERVQGGAFSSDGHLYLSSDRRTGGIHGIDVRTGQRTLHHRIPFEPDAPDNDVIEGLVVADLRNSQVPWLTGTLHALVLQLPAGEPDRVWFRHYDRQRSVEPGVAERIAGRGRGAVTAPDEPDAGQPASRISGRFGPPGSG